jgi:hypothetical protein
LLSSVGDDEKKFYNFENRTKPNPGNQSRV